MKKLLVGLFAVALFFSGKTINVNADGENATSEVSEEIKEEVSEETSEEITTSEESEENEIVSPKLDEEEQEWVDKVAEVLSEVFDAKTVSIITMVLGYVIALIKLVSAVNKARKDKNNTLEDVKEVVLQEVEKRVDSSVKNQVETGINSVYKTCNNMNEVLKVFSKVMALSQENTPESKLAILECISQLGVIEKEVTDSAKEVVNNQVAEEEAHKTETINKIEEMKANVDDGTSI